MAVFQMSSVVATAPEGDHTLSAVTRSQALRDGGACL